MKIKQAYVSPVLSSFRNEFLQKYGLKAYSSQHKPAIFFGCYRGTKGISDAAMIRKHSSFAVIVWAGSDISRVIKPKYTGKKEQQKQFLQFIKKRRDRIKHIAISDYIKSDLNQLGFPFIPLPIVPRARHKAKAPILGDEVYMYSSHDNGEFYGESLLAEIRSKLPGVKFRVCYSSPPGSYAVSKMSNIYKKCFIGLRLTPHDGLANTVAELGLMGRRCVWNGGMLPNAVRWATVKDIVEAIKQESSNIGTANTQLAKEVQCYLNIDKGWLNTKFYR